LFGLRTEVPYKSGSIGGQVHTRCLSP